MQFDSLENLFREKVREAEHSPLPKSQWDREAAFLKVQSQLRYKEANNRKLYYRIAAVLLLGILSSLFLYMLKPTDKPSSELAVQVGSAALPQAGPKPKEGKGPGAVGGKATEINPVEGQLAEAASPQRQPTQRRPTKQVQRAEERETGKPDSVSAAALAAVPSPADEPAAVTGAPSPEGAPLPESAQPPKAPAKRIEVVVVLGGKTLARMASEENREAVALGSGKEPRRQPIEKALKKGRTRSMAINRVKNPLSLDKEI